ncbi:MAG: HAD family hydrolase [Alphaproteobacteria bacterium]|nr:HAD family hydrolase [Alphaproteobacteria bacterium]
MQQPDNMLEKYKTWIFDCDGVLLNSNESKAEAIREIGIELFDAEAAQKLIDYHKAHSGIPRQEIFKGFLIEEMKINDYKKPLQNMLDMFTQKAIESLMTSEQSPNLEEMLKRINEAGNSAFIISGGIQDEVIQVFEKIGLSKYFKGIYGSPISKIEHMQKGFDDGSMKAPSIFIGDSKYDHTSAQSQNADFAFAYEWTAFKDWENYFQNKDVIKVKHATDLIKYM